MLRLKVLFNGTFSASFSFIFSLKRKTIEFLQQTLIFFTKINVKKYQASLWCWDSNPGALEHESPPLTTRPGLSPLRA